MKKVFVFILQCVLIEAASINNKIEDEGKVIFDLDVEKKIYSYRLETPDGTVKHETGHFETDPSTGEESLVVEGGYSFIADDGFQYIVSYKADKDGYHPSVVFGSNLGAAGYGGSTVTTRKGTKQKGIDPALLCSLAGSGCK